MNDFTQSATAPQPEFTMAVTKTYSMTVLHIGKVSDMAQRLGVSQGEVVRQAIDLLWNKLEQNETPQT